MKTIAAFGVAIAIATASATAQETPKKVPKDSMRVVIPGCTKGYIFTAARRTTDEPGSADIPEGTHIRMNGPKPIMSEIKAHEGAMIALTGIMKKGQLAPGGVRIAPGVRVSAGSGGVGGTMGPSPTTSQAMIDVEGWRQIDGSCPTR